MNSSDRHPTSYLGQVIYFLARHVRNSLFLALAKCQPWYWRKKFCLIAWCCLFLCRKIWAHGLVKVALCLLYIFQLKGTFVYLQYSLKSQMLKLPFFWWSCLPFSFLGISRECLLRFPYRLQTSLEVYTATQWYFLFCSFVLFY